LLPWNEQARSRIKTIERVVDKNKDINKDGVIEEQDRHDQIVACTYGVPIKLFGQWEVARVAEVPVPCYNEGFLSSFANFFNLKDEKKISEWKNHLPPLAENFEDFADYWVAYKRWRGERCAIAEVPNLIPVIGGKNSFTVSTIQQNQTTGQICSHISHFHQLKIGLASWKHKV